MTIGQEDLKEIMAAVAAAGIEEFSLEIGDLRVHLKKHQATPLASQPAGPNTPTRIESAGSVTSPSASPSSMALPKAAATSRRERNLELVEESLVAVKAPMIGTFYRAPMPEAPPFVEVGSLVEPDDTVCIVEVMKLMNNLRAGCRGRVAEICAENGALVEFGQTLILIEPAS